VVPDADVSGLEREPEAMSHRVHFFAIRRNDMPRRYCPLTQAELCPCLMRIVAVLFCIVCWVALFKLLGAIFS
jgi:hypothetical protein